MKKFALDLINFIDKSPSAFHAVANAQAILKSGGFIKLNLEDKLELTAGGKYYVIRNDSSIIAFVTALSPANESGFNIVAAHTDSPTFRIKPKPDSTQHGYHVLNTESYGGSILQSWLDRPLTVAGRILIKNSDSTNVESALVHINRALLTIPSVAIHLNTKVNKGIELNKQIDMLPIMGEAIEEVNLLGVVADELKISKETIVDADLFLAPYENGTLLGSNNEFISSARLDNLAMVHAGIHALINAKATTTTNMLMLFNNEESGSISRQGAGSPFASHLLERVSYALGGDREDYLRAIERSSLISADMAHAIHPHHPELHDPILTPKINGGPVIKINANQNYTTDGSSSASIKILCEKAGIEYQEYANRSNIRGGATLGHALMSQLDIKSVDIGNAMLSMHSARELAGTKDHAIIKKLFAQFFKQGL